MHAQENDEKRNDGKDRYLYVESPMFSPELMIECAKKKRLFVDFISEASPSC